MSSDVLIRIESPPSRDWFDDRLKPVSEHAFVTCVTQECVSSIDLILKGRNVLGGYDGAYQYPVHSFVAELIRASHDVLSNGHAIARIYLQQYALGDDAPHHEVSIVVASDDASAAEVTFTWCSSVTAPAGLPHADRERVAVRSLLSAVITVAEEYRAQLRALCEEYQMPIVKFKDVDQSDLIALWHAYGVRAKN